MSRLLTTLEKLSKESRSSIGGSAASKTTKTPARALVGLIENNHVQAATRLSRISPHGVLLGGTYSKDQLSVLVETLKDVPFGLLSEEASAFEDKEIGRDYDFYVVQLGFMAVQYMNDDNSAYVLNIPLDTEDRVLRTIGTLPVDAVFVSLEIGDRAITLGDLSCIGSIRTMVDKYLMVRVPVTISSKEMECLRDIGVDVLVLDVGGSSIKILDNFKEILSNIPRRRKSRKEINVGTSLRQGPDSLAKDLLD